MSIKKKLVFRLRVSKTVIILVTCFSIFIMFYSLKKSEVGSFNEVLYLENIEMHESIVNRFYQSHKSWKTSKLGAVLFKNEAYPTFKTNRTFVILFWKHWDYLQKRHVFYFGSTRHNPLEGCSVNNCIFTGKDDELNTADAVVVHLHRGMIPEVEVRNRTQRWIFLNDEAPHNAFGLSKQSINYENLDSIFNWSMTYSSESDVPVPYGRTIPLVSPKFLTKELSLAKIVPNWKDKQREVLVAILLSNCSVLYRLKFLTQLKNFIHIDVHGKCGSGELKHSCPGHFRSGCPVLSNYLFYLVLENSLCKEYMTEKLFYNAYYRGAIPIIQGPTLKECETFLPPNSYLHVSNYATLKDLADDIKRISENEEELLSYHLWRNHFDAANEHGYFGSKSFHLCRVCEAMNYNDESESIYSKTDLSRFLNTKLLCRRFNTSNYVT